MHKTSCRHLQDVMLTRAVYRRNTSWWHLKDFMKMFWTRLEDIFARCLEDVLKTYEQYICLSQEILKMPWRHLLKTYDQGLYIRLDQDVLKTSSRYCLKTKSKDILKTSSPSGMFAEIELCIYFASTLICHTVYGYPIFKGFFCAEVEFQWVSLQSFTLFIYFSLR